MTEAEWTSLAGSHSMLEFLQARERKPSHRKMRLYSVACCRRIWDLLDGACRGAVETAEQFADGLVSCEELRAVEQALWHLFHRLPRSESILDNHREFILFPIGARKPYIDWKRSQDADLRQFCDPDRLRSELIAEKIYRAALGAATESTWGTLHWHGRTVCNAYADSDAAWGRAGVPSEDPTSWFAALAAENSAQASLLRDIVGNPFWTSNLDPLWLSWNGGTVQQLARAIYDERRFDDLPVLADALEDAGCTDAAILNHCRGPGPHVRGCWVLDLLLGKS
jgi:hypothetical protein